MPDDSANTWTEIQALVDEIAELVESETSVDRFHAETLGRLREVTGAGEAVSWFPRDGEFQPAGRAGGNGRPADAALLERAFATPRAIRTEAEATNATHALCAIRVADEPVGVIEIVQPSATPDVRRRASTQVLEAVAELVGDFHRNRLLVELRDRDRDAEARRAFCRRILTGGSQREVAFHVANEARTYVDCARVSILQRRGRGWRVIAVSGATSVESRARVVRALERLVGTVLRADAEFVHVDGREPSDPLPREILDVLEAYTEESPARLLTVAELRPPSSDGTASRGEFAVVAEHFDLVDSDDIDDRVRRIAPDAALALAAARRPSLLERAAAGGVWWGLLGVAVVLAGVLTFVPADFTVPARGTIEPIEHRRIFAPRGGFVRELQTEYGKDVAADAVVVELVDPDLELEAQRVAGDIETVSLQLAAAEISRLPGRPGTDDGGVDASARAEELEATRDNLLERQRLLDAERKKLVLRSTVAGRVVTPDLERLRERPIERGDLLMEIARFDGRWRLRLDVPDDEFGHVEAARSSDPNLRVEYALATEPERMHEATIDGVALTTELDREGKAVVRADVVLAHSEVPVARPGATVVARIHCGRRSLGYVWFHEALNAVRTWWYR